MDLYKKHGLRRVVNGYDKATHLAGARVLPDIAAVVSESLGACFILDELQAAAGRVISEATGAESGCVTACAAAAITLGVAAAMTGRDKTRVAQLPDTRGMPNRVVIQAGHCISFGVPVAQMIRLSGAELLEAGTAEACRTGDVETKLAEGNVAAIFAVESYHTCRYEGVNLAELAETAHRAEVPLLLDAATQELRLRELVATGADLVSCSAHKYLGSTTAGVVAGRKDLVEAVLVQHRGIGRGMKVGKEGIVGVLAAFESPMWRETEKWTAEEARKVQRVVDLLAGIPGTEAKADPDPNGCPFLRVRLTLDPDKAKHTPDSLKEALAEGDPSVVVRTYPFDRHSVYINTTEMTDEELGVLCNKIRAVMTT